MALSAVHISSATNLRRSAAKIPRNIAGASAAARNPVPKTVDSVVQKIQKSAATLVTLTR